MTSDNGLYLGRTAYGDAWSGAQLSTLVLGPSRSGKTSSVVLPNLLMTSDAAITTSTKTDVAHTIAVARRDVPQLVFDPSGTTPIPPGALHVGYSPIRAAGTWDGAVAVSKTLTDIQRRGYAEHTLDHWSERAATLLASLLHASALAEHSLPEFCARLDLRDSTGPLARLTDRYGEAHPSVSGLQSVLLTNDREQSSIWSTAAGLLRGLRTEGARRVSRYPPVDIDEFLRVGAQLHIVSPSRFQAIAAPLVVGLIDEVVARTYQRPERLLLVLDELANVAPLPQLAGIVSEGGGQGVTTLACLQDLSQARARWGPLADGFLSLFPTTLVLPGIADVATLRALSDLSGAHERTTSNTTFSRRGRVQSTSWSTREQPRLSVADLAHGRANHALALSARKEFGWIGLTPFHRDPRFAPYRVRERSQR
jgi:type IV secretion system protein VirD4